jgi:uncharacterized protein involved in exopolysaccharide biosynthesis
MNQLFRDQCRDACRSGKNWGLIRLWLQVFPDLLRTSLIEHLAAFKEKNMNERINQLHRSPATPLKVSLIAFAGVFVLVLVSSVLITFILPESYRGTARMRIVPDQGTNGPYQMQTAFEVIQSDAILSKVVDDLNLKSKWGQKYYAGNQLSAADAVKLLRKRIDLRPIRNTELVEIRTYGDDPREAAAIANAIAETYREHDRELRRQAGEGRLDPLAIGEPNPKVEIIDAAVPVYDPARPNKALNIFLGAVIGVLLGLLVGGGIGGIAFLFGRNAQKNPA